MLPLRSLACNDSNESRRWVQPLYLFRKSGGIKKTQCLNNNFLLFILRNSKWNSKNTKKLNNRIKYQYAKNPKPITGNTILSSTWKIYLGTGEKLAILFKTSPHYTKGPRSLSVKLDNFVSVKIFFFYVCGHPQVRGGMKVEYIFLAPVLSTKISYIVGERKKGSFRYRQK